MTQTVHPFYRYLRPVTFDKSRHAPVAKSVGGVSFLVLDYRKTDGELYEVELVIAVCPNSQLYGRDVAKRILDNRRDAGHSFTVQAVGLDAESLGRAVIQLADMNRLQVEDTDIYKQYLRHAISEFADAIEYILKSHRSAEFLSRMSSDTVAQLGIGDLYREESK